MTPQIPNPQESDLTDVKDELTEPPQYKVMLHNDDFTPKEFVVEILVGVFNKSIDEATGIMWQAHRNGIGLCGIYPYEVAETKVNVAVDAARENGFPLRLTVEEE
jgi:ATP-dependent Clp protease adaptor protein ClpS